MTPEEIMKKPDGLLFRRQSGHFDIGIQKKGSEIQMVFYQNDQTLEIQARMDLLRPNYLSTPYTQAMVGALVWQPNPQKVFFGGLGGGRLATVLHHVRPETFMTAAEIDNEVFSLAREYFGFQEDSHVKVVIDDCRTSLEATEDIFDIIFIDVFTGNGSEVPSLTTQEFFSLCKKKLVEKGVICINAYPKFPRYYNQIKVLLSLFNHVATIPVGKNAVLVAFQEGEIQETVIQQTGVDLVKKHNLQFPVNEHLDRIQFLDKISRAKILHDKQ